MVASYRWDATVTGMLIAACVPSAFVAVRLSEIVPLGGGLPISVNGNVACHCPGSLCVSDSETPLKDNDTCATLLDVIAVTVTG